MRYVRPLRLLISAHLAGAALSISTALRAEDVPAREPALATEAASPLPARPAGAPVDSASPEQRRAALEKYEAGCELFDRGEQGQALVAFRESYRIVASPNARLMIARSLGGLGRPAEAYAEYERVAAEADAAARADEKYTRTAEAAREGLAAERRRVGLLTVRVNGAPPDADLRVAGRRIEVSDTSRPLRVPTLWDVRTGALIVGELGVGAGTGLYLTSEPSSPATASTGLRRPRVRIGARSVSVSVPF